MGYGDVRWFSYWYNSFSIHILVIFMIVLQKTYSMQKTFFCYFEKHFWSDKLGPVPDTCRQGTSLTFSVIDELWSELWNKRIEY